MVKNTELGRFTRVFSKRGVKNRLILVVLTRAFSVDKGWQVFNPKIGFWDRVLNLWIHERGNLTQIVSEISFPAFYTKIRGFKQKKLEHKRNET